MMVNKLLCSNLLLTVLYFSLTSLASAQPSPYDQFPEADPPYYRVRYEPSEANPQLVFGVNYTIWIPEDVRVLRGVIVHQHGCGEGSCQSGLSGAFDVHWQALARQHGCALMSPAYEQPAATDCQLWCDPRNGSGKAFQKALVDLGEQSGHPELHEVPWALWGHSGGGHWAGGMVLLHPDRVAAAWLRSGVPLLRINPDRPLIHPHQLSDQVLRVPIMCNPGTKEGVTVTEGRFARVWPANEDFFYDVRGRGGLIGVAVDPLTSHECGNQRYLAIPWLDACLEVRLPDKPNQSLREMKEDGIWLSNTPGFQAQPAEAFEGDRKKSTWLPNAKIARQWMQYVQNTEVEDESPPPRPEQLSFSSGTLTWSIRADLQSGLGKFLIYRDGKRIGQVPEKEQNRFGRPLFQNLLYSDTPTLPLASMDFSDRDWKAGQQHIYQVVAVNTVGLESSPSEPIRALEESPE